MGKKFNVTGGCYPERHYMADMLSFNFNQRKEVGVKEIKLGNKTLAEAVV